MKNVEVEVEEEEEVSPSSSPPTPPSPLPISVGPGNTKYYFSSSSPSPSPPFSPPTSADKLPLLPNLNDDLITDPRTPSNVVVHSAFSLSLDRRYDASSSTSSNCLRDLLEWFVIRCCSCCLTLNTPPKLHQS